MYVQWSPIPRRPWGVHESDGKVIKRFDSAYEALAYMKRLERLSP